MEILKFILSCFFLILSTLGISQEYFFHYFTASTFDEGYGVVELPNSHYALTGSSGAFDDSSSQAFLTVTDEKGNPLWTKNYGGDADDIGVRIFYQPNDGFYIAGYTNSTANGDFDFVVYKTDEQGELQWEKHYGTDNWEKLNDAKLLPDGSLLLVGHTEGLTTMQKDIYIVKIDGDGEILWTKTIATPQDDIANAVDTLSQTEFVIGGVLGDDGVSKGFFGFFDLATGDENKIVICDENGITNVRHLSVYDNQVHHTIQIFVSGEIFVPNSDKYNLWIARYTPTGDFDREWYYEYQKNSTIINFVVCSQFKLIIAYYSDSPELNPFPIGYDTFLWKIATGLESKEWDYNISYYGDDFVNQMIATKDGGFAFIGRASESLDNESLQGLGSNIMFGKVGPNDEVVQRPKESSSFLGLQEEIRSILSVYPNPTKEILNVPLSAKGLSYQLFDYQGREVAHGILENSINLNTFQPGIYFLKVVQNNQIWTSKIVKE